MARINLKVQGVKGNNSFKPYESKGAIFVKLEDDNRKETGIIIIDAFEGYGETYQRRDNNKIIIQSESGVTVFEGCFEELLNKLK
jgi:hypothetical protein